MQSLMGETTPLGNAVAPQERAAWLFQAPQFIDGVTDN